MALQFVRWVRCLALRAEVTGPHRLAGVSLSTMAIVTQLVSPTKALRMVAVKVNVHRVHLVAARLRSLRMVAVRAIVHRVHLVAAMLRPNLPSCRGIRRKRFRSMRQARRRTNLRGDKSWSVDVWLLRGRWLHAVIGDPNKPLRR